MASDDGLSVTTPGVLFIDLCDSSRWYREFGDRIAADAIGSLLDGYAEIVRRIGGVVVDRIGDELFCTFDNASDTLAAAVELQTTTRELNQIRPDLAPVAARVGLHIGEVLREGDRVTGESVYLAKRLVDAAKAEQVTVVESTIGAVEGHGFSFRYLETTTLHGRSTPSKLFEFVWGGGESVTVALQQSRAGLRLPHDLTVSWGDNQWRVAEGQSLSIGRTPPADIVIPEPVVSRLHARLSVSKGRCFLTDLSTNGTFIDQQGREVRYLRRDRMELLGTGNLWIGRKPKTDGAPRLNYSCSVNLTQRAANSE